MKFLIACVSVSLALSATNALTLRQIFNAPRLHNTVLNTTYTQNNFGSTYYPTTSADFQNAINAAQPGDTIVLEAGATYVGEFILPYKGTSENYITIRSSRLSELPEGVRVTPAQSYLMPRLVPPGRCSTALDIN